MESEEVYSRKPGSQVWKNEEELYKLVAGVRHHILWAGTAILMGINLLWSNSAASSRRSVSQVWRKAEDLYKHWTVVLHHTIGRDSYLDVIKFPGIILCSLSTSGSQPSMEESGPTLVGGTRGPFGYKFTRFLL